MAHPDSKIIYLRDQIASAAKPAGKRAKVQSMYDQYPLPFFDGKRRCAWSAKATGRYFDGFETGHAYALQFLRTCDDTAGWNSPLAKVVGDMVGAWSGERWPSGEAKTDGIITGFMITISRALCSVDPATLNWIEEEQRRQAARYRERLAKLASEREPQ